jgi:pyruvate formate lyase activating enzyme
MKGRIHSFQSLGTVDGPGIRAVVFMQGCPLRCACCHNPDTWSFSGGSEISVDEIFEKIKRLRAYFGKEGGITVSGGEPLMQADFVAELFDKAHAEGINCALDTSGCVMSPGVERLIDLTDIVLLDYKYTNASDYEKYCGCSIEAVDSFLEMLSQKNKRVWLRQVIIPTLNDTPESLEKLYALKNRYPCIEKIELLPFRKICLEKYSEMGIDFPLADVPEAGDEQVARLLEQIQK